MLTWELIPMLPSEFIPIVHHSDANIGSNPIPTSEFIPMLPSELIHPSEANIGSNPILTSEFIPMLTLELIPMPDIFVHPSFRCQHWVHSDSDIRVHSDADIGVHSDADIGAHSDCPSFTIPMPTLAAFRLSIVALHKIDKTPYAKC